MADRPWLRSYPPAVPKTLEPYPERSVFAILEEAVAQWPDSPAVAFFGKRLTYKELMAEVERFSRVLASMGIQKGDRIAFVLPNCPQYVIAFFACQRLGAVVVGNNPLYTQREMTHQLNDAGTETVICLDQLYPLVNAVRGDTPIKRVLVTKITDYMPFPLKQLAPLKFKREAKHEGRPWPPVPADADVEWWADLMKGSYPEVPVA
ncbi:MAG TPA: AMP-binding protein, partial [Actinomycetota bacterium]|nr:AMP-binding protein [Actinomycetota bacterium]